MCCISVEISEIFLYLVLCSNILIKPPSFHILYKTKTSPRVCQKCCILTLSPRPLMTSTIMGHPQLQTAPPACAWINATSTLWSWGRLPWNGGLLPGDKTQGSYIDYILLWRNRVSSSAINLSKCLFSIYLMLLSLLFGRDNYRPPEKNLSFQLHRMSPVLRSHSPTPGEQAH